MNMKIKQISFARNEEQTDIYGLGEDGLIYYWSYGIGMWIINANPLLKLLTNKTK